MFKAIKIKRICLLDMLGAILGLVFIFSSLSKAVNVVAFARTVASFVLFLGFDFLTGHEMLIAYAICSAELLLGLMLFNRRLRYLAVSFTILLMVFFTCITYYNFVMPQGNIESCGCFGELVHLTPWESFAKNIVLLLLALTLWGLLFFRSDESNDDRTLSSNVPIMLSTVFALLLPAYSLLFVERLSHTLYLGLYIAICMAGLALLWLRRQR